MGNMKSTGFAVYAEDISKQEDGFKAKATLDFKGVNPSDGNYIKFNGTQFTFRKSPQTDSEVQLGDNISATLDNLLAKTNLPTDVTYTKIGTDKLFIEYKTIGASGNDWTIGCDFVSLPTSLTGGSDIPDPDWEKVSDTTINYKPKEINVLSNTTNTALILGGVVSKNDNLILINPDNSFKEFKADNPVAETTTKTLDIFGDNSCIACYPFDGNADDLSGNYNGVWKTYDANSKKEIDGQASYVRSKFGQAALVEPVNNVPNAIALSKDLLTGTADGSSAPEYKSGTITISAHIAVISGSDFVVYNTGGCANGYGVGVKNNKLFMCVQNSDKYETLIGLTDIVNNKVYHVVYTYDASSKKGAMYLNGKLEGTKTFTINPGSRSSLPRIGTIPYPSSTFYNDTALHNTNGTIDQFRAFNRALTDDEIEKLQYEIRTTLDITKAGLSNAPVKAFFNSKPLLGISLEPARDDIIPVVTEEKIPVLNGSTNKTLVTSDLLEGEELIIGSSELKINNNIKVGSIDTTQTLDILGDNSCIATYPLDGNADDLSGNHNGSWSGTEAYDTGKYGKAAKFTKDTNTYISGIPLQLTSNGFSISFWCNPASLGGDEAISYGGNGDVFWAFRSTSNGTHVYVHVKDTYVINATIPEVLSLNEWNHIVFNYDNNNLTIYKNNVLYKKLSGSNSTYPVSGNFWLGNETGDKRYPFNGLIDQVRIFNKALTADETQILYKEQKVKYDISSLNLTDVPQLVIRKGYLPLTKESSSITEFIGTSELNLPLKTGDKVITDQGEVEVTKVNKETKDTTQTLDILGDGSCIACYPLDGNANDLSGKYNGTWKTRDSKGNLVEGGVAYIAGKYGKAADLSGDNTTITTDLVFGTGVKALSFWTYMTESHGDGVLFAQDGTDSTRNYIAFDINGNFRIAKSNTTSLKFPSPSYRQWHHIVIQDTGSTIEAYVDGVKQPNSITTYNSLSGLQISNFGYYPNNPSTNSGHCYIDQVRIFNKALTADEITKLYKEQINKYTIGYKELSVAPNFLAIPQRTKFIPMLETKFDGKKFNSKYGTLAKQGRAIQRRIVLPEKDIEVIPPFQSQMWKKN